MGNGVSTAGELPASEVVRDAAIGELGCAAARPDPRGKFLFRGREKLYVRGVTYGTFRPNDEGQEFHDRQVVATDFAAMAEHGVNSVRTYTVPPRWLLDLAEEQGLSVLVGIPWEQHVAFLDDRGALARSCAACGRCRRLRRSSGGARLHGRKRDPGADRALARTPAGRAIRRAPVRRGQGRGSRGLVTYVNYPTTEYLELPFLDFCAFNVYLETATGSRRTSPAFRTWPATGRC